MGLLAQHAYGKSQKIEIGLSNNSLSGIILSPKAEMPERMEEYIAEMQARNVELYFDPQFYICAFEGDIGCGKLDKYNFYPEGIINKKYLSIPSNIQDIVKRNIEYQKKCNMKTIISPNIFFESFDSRMSQIALSLANESIRYMESENIMISICVHESAFANFEDVKDFLDIITLFEVEGFYVIIERNNYNTPNMIDSDSMANIMYFLYNLSTINMYKVILGYGDYVGIPMYATGIDSIATGWYENTRKFDRKNFEQKGAMRRPNKRYFSNKIMNSLLLIPEIQMIKQSGKLGEILSNTDYDHFMYNDLAGSAWTDVNSCVERWAAIKQIIDKIDKEIEVKDKINFMRQYIFQASQIYKELPEEYFETKSKSSHLKVWDDGLKRFEEMLKDI